MSRPSPSCWDVPHLPPDVRNPRLSEGSGLVGAGRIELPTSCASRKIWPLRPPGSSRSANRCPGPFMLTPSHRFSPFLTLVWGWCGVGGPPSDTPSMSASQHPAAVRHPGRGGRFLCRNPRWRASRFSSIEAFTTSSRGGSSAGKLVLPPYARHVTAASPAERVKGNETGVAQMAMGSFSGRLIQVAWGTVGAWGGFRKRSGRLA